MPSARRLAAAVTLIVLGVSAGNAQDPLRPPKEPLPDSSPAPASPPTRSGPDARTASLPELRLGALLPLTGASAWYAEEMRHGMELAVADLNPPQPRTGSATAAASTGADPKAPPTEPGGTRVAPPPALRVVLEVLDVQPLNVKDAASHFARLAAAGTTVVFTASATPTLAIYPLAASRGVLVVHQGLPSDRFPRTRQTLLHTRPSAAVRGEALAAYAWERGIRRLALLAAGDEFGKAVRASLSARWRDRGASLAHEESLALEAPDLPARLARVARLAPDAVCLAFRGQDLGELARRLRDAGYSGLLLGLDDDRAALLAAGPTLTDTLLLVDSFVPKPESLGARFAKTYEAKFKRAPSRFAANAYDAVSVVAEGARLALRHQRSALAGARLRETLMAGRTFPSLYGGQIGIRDDGTFERPLALFTIERGREVFVHYVTPAGRPVLEGSRVPTGGRVFAAAL